MLFALLQILLIGFRHSLMGLHDTHFIFLRNLSRIYYFGTDFILENGKDLLFQYLSLFYTNIFGLNESLYIFLLSIPYIAVMTYLIYKYSNNIFLSFILFTSTPLFSISFTLMRQVNAMSVLIVAFFALEAKKLKTFFVLVVIASFLHQVAIIFLIVPVLLKYFNRRSMALILPTLGLVLGFFFRPLIEMFVYLVVDANERFIHMITRAQANNLTPFFVFLTIVWATAFFSMKAQDLSLKKYITISSVGLLFLSFTVVNREFARVGYLFLPFLLIAYPNALSFIKRKKDKLLIQILSTTVFVIYFLFFLVHTTGLYPYVPFWQVYPL